MIRPKTGVLLGVTLLSTRVVSTMVVYAQPPEPPKPKPAVVTPVVVEDTWPHQTLTSFVEALNNNDFPAAASRVVGGQAGEALKELADKWQARRGSWQMQVRDIETQYERDHAATVTFRLRLHDHWGNRITHDERLNLRKNDKLWKIVPPSPDIQHRALAEGGDNSLLEHFAFLLAQPPQTAEDRAQKCMTHLKYLAIGARQFTQDWDDIFSFKADKFPGALLSYVHSARAYHCPDDISGEVSYAFNVNLENVVLERVQQPAQTVMFYEGKNGQLEFRHDQRAAVCFVDGHVELVTAERAKPLKWKP